MRISIFFLAYLVSSCTPGVISVFDNGNPRNPTLISSSVSLPDGTFGPNCGCASTERPNYEDSVVPDSDKPVSCSAFRPISSTSVRPRFANLMLEIADRDGVGCVQIVASKSELGDVFDAQHNDTSSVVDIPMGNGNCPGHIHSGHDSDDLHYRFQYDGTRINQKPTFSFFRHNGTDDDGILFLRSWISASYTNGSERTFNADRIYVFGPRDAACN